MMLVLMMRMRIVLNMYLSLININQWLSEKIRKLTYKIGQGDMAFNYEVAATR